MPCFQFSLVSQFSVILFNVVAPTSNEKDKKKLFRNFFPIFLSDANFYLIDKRKQSLGSINGNATDNETGLFVLHLLMHYCALHPPPLCPDG
jgi:hypothetical protein